MKPNPKIVYLCGPITGMPNGNRQAFEEAEDYYIALGYMVINPHTVADYMPGKPESEIVKNELASISTIVDCIALLPGWKNSRYGLVEVSVGLACGIPFLVAGTEKQTSPTLKLSAYGSQGSKTLVAWRNSPTPMDYKKRARIQVPY